MPNKPNAEGLEEMVDAYAVAALWASPYRNDSSTVPKKDQPENMDDEFSLGDLSHDLRMTMTEDCKRFTEANKADIGDADPQQVGHDLWLSRNGHGAGFFDREHIYGEERAQRLQAAARKMGTFYLYADDGTVFGEKG